MTSDEDAELRRMCGRLLLTVDQLLGRVETLEAEQRGLQQQLAALVAAVQRERTAREPRH